MEYIIRAMKPEEMKTAISWAAEEGWNPGLNDGDCFYKTDPGGFFVGELNGEIIATKSAVRYPNNFGFMGFYIVKKEYRGKGYGLKIWRHGFNNLAGMTSGMDGVVDQQPNYKKSGYVFAYRQMRFEGKGISGMYKNLKSLNEISFEDLVKYDSQMFPSERKVFLDMWVNQTGISFKASLKNGKLVGYGVIRPCVKGYKIGPLFADNEEVAENLFLGLCDFADGSEVYLDVPEINIHALNLIKKYKMNYVFETARMYHNGFPNMDVNKIFGVTTFELG